MDLIFNINFFIIDKKGHEVIAEIDDGLSGELYEGNGWIKEYSKISLWLVDHAMNRRIFILVPKYLNTICEKIFWCTPQNIYSVYFMFFAVDDGHIF